VCSIIATKSHAHVAAGPLAKSVGFQSRVRYRFGGCRHCEMDEAVGGLDITLGHPLAGGEATDLAGDAAAETGRIEACDGTDSRASFHQPIPRRLTGESERSDHPDTADHDTSGHTISVVTAEVPLRR
jgi:hypothetical protein